MPDVPPEITIGTTDTPNPGSQEATKQGCTCAIMDNNHGQGYRGQPNVYVITSGCPLHAPTEKTDAEPT